MEKEFPNYLRSWIVESVSRGCTVASVKKTLKTTTDFSEYTIDFELQAAIRSPYTEGARKIGDRLARREWLLKSLDNLARLDCGYPRLDVFYEVPKYDDFVKCFMAKNKPVLLKRAVWHWKAMDWTLDRLKERVGDVEVGVQAGRSKNKNFEKERAKHGKAIKMREFLDCIEEVGVTNDVYMTAYNAKSVTENLYELVGDYGNIGDGYIDMSKQRMISDSALWIGPAGTRTPMHFDTKNNFFVQLFGSKKVYLIPPAQIPYMYNLDNYFSLVQDYENYDEKKFPELKKVKPIEVVVEKGDALFIPLSWFHFVKSLEVSISHTFLNFSGFKKNSNNFPIYKREPK